jgi:hypothetical protein
MDDLTPRCLCGHLESEHEAKLDNGYATTLCYGAYATLTRDADDQSVEVPCPCFGFSPVTDGYHDVR